MVLPSSGDLEVSLGDRERPKAVACEHSLRRPVVQQRRRLDPVRAEFPEAGPTTSATAAEARPCPARGSLTQVAYARPLECPAADVVQVDPPTDRAASIQNGEREHPVPFMRRKVAREHTDTPHAAVLGEVPVVLEWKPRGKVVVIRRQLARASVTASSSAISLVTVILCRLPRARAASQAMGRDT